MVHDRAVKPHPTLRTIFAVYIALMLLLVLTLAAAELEAGPWSAAVALAIAGLKAALILLFFMHVWYSPTLTWLVAGAGFFWLAILFEFTLSDYLTRRQTPYVQPMSQGTASENVDRPAGPAHTHAPELPSTTRTH